MTSRHRRVAAAGLAVSAMTLGACSSSTPDLPEATPSASASASTDGDGDGYTADERDAVDAVNAYADALVEYQKGDRDIDLTGVATDEIADGIVTGVKDTFDDEDLVMIGEYTLTIESVSVTEDTGEVQACNNSSQLFLVKEGEDQPGVGSQQLTEFAITYGVVRQDGSWVVSELDSKNQPC